MHDADAGMVSAELAAAFPAVVLALLLVLGAAQHGITATRAQEAARVAARSAARGDPLAEQLALARRAAPGANLTSTRSGSRVQVRITVPARGPVAWLIPFGRFTAEATAALEEVPP